MIRIAIIEDDTNAQKGLLDFLAKYGNEKNETFQNTVFSCAEDFLNGYESQYDLILMDIELPKMNGMDASKKLRSLGDKTTLVFITNLAQFAIGGYEVGAFDFILKPITYSGFYLKFNRILQKVHDNHGELVTIKSKHMVKRLSVNQILYVEVSNHNIIFHSIDGIIETRGSLSTIAKQFDKSHFSFCNQSYLVNLAFVKSYDGEEVTVGNDHLKISRPKKKKFLQDANAFFSALQ